MTMDAAVPSQGWRRVAPAIMPQVVAPVSARTRMTEEIPAASGGSRARVIRSHHMQAAPMIRTGCGSQRGSPKS